MELLILLLLILVSQHVSGVEVYEGAKSVLLPCQVPADVASDSTAAVWDHKDLNITTVHVRLQSGDDFKEQNNRYTKRTSMRADALETGDLSLTLRNPTVSDSGTYTCTTRRLGQDLSRIHLQLKVRVSPHASGVEVFEGATSVLLPCQVPANVSSDSSAAVWDLDIPTVHVRLQNGDDFEGQNQHYTSRTSMRADALQTGDLSLILRNPKVSDSGTYTCSIHKDGQDQSRYDVQLKVKEPPPLWPKVISVVLLPVVLLAAAFGVFMYFRYKMLKSKEVLKVEAHVGEESVTLPCRSAVHPLSGDTTVEWKDRNGRKVHVYQGGRDCPQLQHRRYRNRTQVNSDLLKTGDLSLTLRYPTNTDRDTYTCTVYRREGKGNMEKQVELKITECEVKVEEGVESVQLPFRTTKDLPGDSEVEWKRYEPEYMKVHMYYKTYDQPDRQDKKFKGRTEMVQDPLGTGDLSLTLKSPTKGDTGRYGCEVNSKEAWRYKRVFLTVTGKNEGQTQRKEDSRKGRDSMEMAPLMLYRSV